MDSYIDDVVKELEFIEHFLISFGEKHSVNIPWDTLRLGSLYGEIRSQLGIRIQQEERKKKEIAMLKKQGEYLKKLINRSNRTKSAITKITNTTTTTTTTGISEGGKRKRIEEVDQKNNKNKKNRADNESEDENNASEIKTLINVNAAPEGIQIEVNAAPEDNAETLINLNAAPEEIKTLINLNAAPEGIQIEVNAVSEDNDYNNNDDDDDDTSDVTNNMVALAHARVSLGQLAKNQLKRIYENNEILKLIPYSKENVVITGPMIDSYSLDGLSKTYLRAIMAVLPGYETSSLEVRDLLERKLQDAIDRPNEFVTARQLLKTSY